MTPDKLEKLISKFLKEQSKHVLTVESDGFNISVDFDGNASFLIFNAVATALQNGMDEDILDEIIDIAKGFAIQQGGRNDTITN